MLQVYGTTWTDYLDIKDGVGIFVKKTFQTYSGCLCCGISLCKVDLNISLVNQTRN